MAERLERGREEERHSGARTSAAVARGGRGLEKVVGTDARHEEDRAGGRNVQLAAEGEHDHGHERASVDDPVGHHADAIAPRVGSARQSERGERLERRAFGRRSDRRGGRWSWRRRRRRRRGSGEEASSPPSNALTASSPPPPQEEEEGASSPPEEAGASARQRGRRPRGREAWAREERALRGSKPL